MFYSSPHPAVLASILEAVMWTGTKAVAPDGAPVSNHSDTIVWIRFGMGLGAACFVTALGRLIAKRLLWSEVRKVELGHALEQERARIARDMHDQLGASLTQIGLFAGLAQVEGGDGKPVAHHLSRLVKSAREAVAALDEIVWAVDPRYDTLPSLIEYLGQYAADYARSAGIRCRLDIPADPPCGPVPADFRHNLYLIVREALNNAIKHAAAREIRLRIHLNGGALLMEIGDDGRGMPNNGARAGARGCAIWACAPPRWRAPA